MGDGAWVGLRQARVDFVSCCCIISRVRNKQIKSSFSPRLDLFGVFRARFDLFELISQLGTV